nr:division/cell wall cluster transcriptional repressor MraZ [Propionibacteriales bacterium]
MFLGTHFPRLDEKGRIFLPAKFREELSEGLVVTRGQERCLYVWPSAEFRSFTEELRKTPVTNKRARNFMRMLSAGASAELADKQGRVTLPQMLRDYAGLQRE